MEEVPHPDLQRLRSELREIYIAMATFGSSQLAAKPPILDLSGDSNNEFHSHQDAVHGLRALKDAVRRDLDVLEKVSLIHQVHHYKRCCTISQQLHQ